MLRIRPSIRLRLLHCVRQSACRDGRVDNKPIRAGLRAALGKLRQRFERTGFEQVMGVLSVCAFDGKGVFLPVVDGGFSVADFGGTPA